jgi:hypothetical protein
MWELRAKDQAVALGNRHAGSEVPERDEQRVVSAATHTSAAQDKVVDTDRTVVAVGVVGILPESPLGRPCWFWESGCSG